MPSPADELVVEAELVSSETSRRPTAPFYKALASIIATFPSYKDSRSGRKNAKQLKIIFVVIGLITQLAIAGTELLFLDSATFEDRSQHVRGGIPILFPFF